LNDLENRPIAQPEKDSLEWTVSSDDVWTSYKDKEPNVKGDKTLLVRRRATGLTAASDAIEYQFTEDNQPATRRYIPIKHLTMHAFSTQSVDSSRPFYAPNAIDGNPDTLWHTDFRYSVLQQKVKPFLTIKLDEPKIISALEFVQKKYSHADPIYTKNATVYVSMDGENWTQAGRVENCEQTVDLKTINFKNGVEGQYVKFEMETYDIFAAISMINLYEDISNRKVPTAEIEYDIKSNTNQKVTAKLVNPSTEITITNNGGKDTYIFEKNGEFTFEFEDNYGKKGTAKAKVDWIIKTLPTATVTYNTTKPTNQKVTAEISFDRDKTRIVDENGNTIQTLALGEKYAYTFTENGTKEVKFIGPYGNAGSKTLKVDWIDKIAPIATVEYSTKNPTNKNVVATVKFNEDNVKITNNGGKNTYTFTENGTFTFEFEDEAGNTGTVLAKVDYIDRTLAMPTIIYSTTSPTNKDVVATITFDKENVTIEGGNTHIFTENGTYEFKYVGPAGNKGVAVAEVTWIDKKAPAAIITYSENGLTNKDVIASIAFDESDVRILNNNGKNTYTFAENGTFTFEYQDKAGNKGSTAAVVSIIDKEAPIAKVLYSTTRPTNEDVTATLTGASEDITIINNDGKDTYTFTENGEFTFEFQDKAGNIGSVTARVNWIQKEGIIANISYSTTKLTNQDVVATIEFSDVGVAITNNNGRCSYTFKENGEFTFEYIDQAGNIGSATARVNWIDRVAPKATVIYNIANKTNQNVVATIRFDKQNVRVTNNNGKNTYTFTENGEFTFEFVDEAGNIGKMPTKVNWIDKEPVKATVSYSITDLTNKDVVATIRLNKKNARITNNNGKNTYTFTENGEFIFEFQDKVGNKGTAKAKVDWISQEELASRIVYSTTNMTNKDVIATIEFNKEDVRILNNDGSNTYTFTKNGEFTFEYIDEVGNTGSAKAEVTWIDKEAPIAIVSYSTIKLTNQDVVATIHLNEVGARITNNNGSNTYTFTKNGEFTFEFVDEAGNTGSAKAEVTWIDKEVPQAVITYDIPTVTDKDVIATIKFNKEDVSIINNNGSNTYTFTKNGEFVFEFQDKAGNKGTASAKVDWIEKEKFAFRVSYDISTLTNQNVTAMIHFNKDNVKITNNDGKNTYIFTKNGEFTFEFIDNNGNKGEAIAKVNWIDKEIPKATITYNIMSVTDQNVVAKIQFNKQNVKVINNDSKNTYTFVKNGEFTFEFVDEAGNKGSALARVNWIKKNPGYHDPSRPSGPGVMEDPIQPSNPSIVPEQPSVSNVPSVITKPSIFVESNSNYDNGSQTQKEQPQYSTFKTGIISVKIPNNMIQKNGSLGYKQLKLKDTIKKKLNGKYQGFDVYFETDDDTKNYFENTSIIMTLDVLSTEDLVLYKLTDNNELIELDYRDIGNHKIEIETIGLGKYILSYRQDENADDGEGTVSKVDDNTHSSLDESDRNIYIIGLSFILLLLITILVIQVRKKRNNF